jgi:hypothetical protein
MKHSFVYSYFQILGLDDKQADATTYHNLVKFTKVRRFIVQTPMAAEE